MLSITPPKFTDLITGCLYTLTILTHFLPLATSKLFSELFFFCLFVYFQIPYMSELIQYLTLSDLFHLV